MTPPTLAWLSEYAMPALGVLFAVAVIGAAWSAIDLYREWKAKRFRRNVARVCRALERLSAAAENAAALIGRKRA